MKQFRPLLGRPNAAQGPIYSAITAAQRHRPRRSRSHPETCLATAAAAAAAFRCVTTARARRKPAAPKKDVPLYEIPLAVLDLDAEDNPHVRPYDEVTEAEETAKWRAAHASIDALAERLDAFAQDADRAEARMKAVAATPGPWRVADRDIWSVALLGIGSSGGRRGGGERKEPHRAVQDEEAILLAELLYRHGISSRAASEPSKAIQFLLHRQSIVQKGGIDIADELMQALTSCQSLVETRRLLSLATRTTTGCTVVTQCGQAVADHLSSFLSSSSTSVDRGQRNNAATAVAESISTMLLNFSYSFASKDSELGQALCSVGLRAAAESGVPAAMKQFLQIGLPAGYFTEADSRTGPQSAVLSALSTVRASLQGTGVAGLDDARTELFSLLTGTSFLRPTSTGEVSFRAALGGQDQEGKGSVGLLGSAVTPGQRDVYLAVLAELGGVRTLWEEQHSSGASAAVVDADTLATGVLRYAAYIAGTQPAASGAQTSATAASSQGGAETDDERRGAEKSSLLDLQTIHAYETATATAKQPPSIFPTLQPATGAQPPSPLAAAIAVDDAFRTRVVEAFSKGTVGEAVEAIDALLAQ